MNEVQRKNLIFYIEVIIYITIIILLIINYIQMRSDSFKCVRNPKAFLVEHFEKLTKGNISCWCNTDNPKFLTPGGSSGPRIWFGSYDHMNPFKSESPFNFSNLK